MFRVRGKTKKGLSVTGQSAQETYADAAKEVEASVKKSGDTLLQLSLRPLDEGAGISIAQPRKRK